MFANRGATGHVDRRRDDVVRGLAVVDVVVGVYGRLARQGPVGQGRDHLVGVHVGRGAGSSLVDVEGELVVPVASGHFARRRRDRVGQLDGHQPQLRVGFGGRLLEPPQRLDEPAGEAPPADGKVLGRPLGLGAVECVGGNPHLAQGVLLDSMGFGHDRIVRVVDGRTSQISIASRRSGGGTGSPQVTAQNNPVALVTGGGVRVGRAIALGLAESGYDLVVSHHSSGRGAAEVAEASRVLGRRVRTVQADLSRESDARSTGSCRESGVWKTRPARQFRVQFRRQRSARGHRGRVGGGHGGESACAVPPCPRDRRPAAGVTRLGGPTSSISPRCNRGPGTPTTRCRRRRSSTSPGSWREGSRLRRERTRSRRALCSRPSTGPGGRWRRSGSPERASGDRDARGRGGRRAVSRRGRLRHRRSDRGGRGAGG